MFHCVVMINEHKNKTFLYDLEENDVLSNQSNVKTVRKEN
jgi:hypothetical protein